MNVVHDDTGIPRSTYLNDDGVMVLLHIRSRTTLYRYIAEGLPSHQIRPRGRRLYDPDEVRAWIDSRWSRPAQGRPA